MTANPTQRDYSLVGLNAKAAIESGLASAEWYHTDIPRKTMKELMTRRDGPAIRDTIIWLGCLSLFGAGGVYFWGTWWCVPFFICYGVLYGSATDSRWHECGHRTAFKTQWMNDVIYNLASFMVFREPTIWRWSHTRHHSDTIIVGRDPEITTQRPPDILGIFLNIFAIKGTFKTLLGVIGHAMGKMTEDEKDFVPESEFGKVYMTARIWLVIHAAVIVFAIATRSLLPLMLVGLLPTMYGNWFGIFVGLTQHAGLAENVLDHRLNSRTVYMNAVSRFIYWNMNYHVEHHMFPMVPFHSLPKLHEIMKPDTPKPYSGMIEAYREIIPALVRQRKDPNYYVKRELPPTARPYRPELHGQQIVTAG